MTRISLRNQREYVKWDVVNWSRALAVWLRQVPWQDVESKLVLEVGAREGGLSLWALDLGFSVHCTDRHVPLAATNPVFRKAAAKGRITFGEWDLLSGPCDRQGDIVIGKSVLGALGNAKDLVPQRQAIKNIHDSLQAGGQLWLAENCVGSPLHMYARKRFVPWGNKWLYFTRSQLKELLGIFASVHVVYVGFLGAFGRREWQRSLLGMMDKAFDWILPDNWRYIAIVVAKKGW